MTKREKEAVIKCLKDLALEVDAVLSSGTPYYDYLADGDQLRRFIKLIEDDKTIFLGKPELIDFIKRGNEEYVVCRCGPKEPTIEDEDSYLTFSFLEQIDDTLYELRKKRIKEFLEETIKKIQDMQ